VAISRFIQFLYVSLTPEPDVSGARHSVDLEYPNSSLASEFIK
jgi:hypothetical protein